MTISKQRVEAVNSLEALGEEVDLATNVLAVAVATLVVAWLIAFAILLVMYGEGPRH
jgi:hypothetical protein